MLDLNDLAMFVQVVRAGSFSEAARRLHMPANTLSRRIDQFEGQLGTRLLHRSTRKLATSAEGQALFERYAPALDQIFEIERHNVDRQAPSGSVRVIAIAACSNSSAWNGWQSSTRDIQTSASISCSTMRRPT